MATIPFPTRSREPETLVTAEEIAQRWGVHRDTIYRIPPSELPPPQARAEHTPLSLG